MQEGRGARYSVIVLIEMLQQVKAELPLERLESVNDAGLPRRDNYIKKNNRFFILLVVHSDERLSPGGR